ncbi:MAG: GNAT family N-acetyltransferase [Oscillospiraceae bacterium]|nr:GNAT family N-acetyltransferase [Oscillospiraceae bacterium]
MCKDIKLADDEIYSEIYQLLDGDGDNPPTYRLCIKTLSDNNIVGRCSFRVGDNTNRHIKYGGNIGYDIDEPYRGNKYSLKACKLLLVLAKSHGMTSVYITCDPGNNASRRICELLETNFVGILDLPEDDYNYINNGTKQHCIYEIKL